jgi:hypothetical protein
MSTTEAAIQINFKTKRDGMLINLRANDAIELDGLLGALTERLAQLIDLEQTVEKMAQPAPSAPQIPSAITDAFPNAQVQGYAPAVQGYKPAGVTPDCTCGGGPMRLVPAGIAKSTGRPYKGFYACPKPQGAACQNKVPA